MKEKEEKALTKFYFGTSKRKMLSFNYAHLIGRSVFAMPLSMAQVDGRHCLTDGHMVLCDRLMVLGFFLQFSNPNCLLWLCVFYSCLPHKSRHKSGSSQQSLSGERNER